MTQVSLSSAEFFPVIAFNVDAFTAYGLSFICLCSHVILTVISIQDAEMSAKN